MDTERFISDVVSLQPMMQRVAVRFLHDDDLAADAVQEALIQLWHKRWRLGMMKDCRSYCMRTLRNRCIDILRQHSHDSIPLEEADRFPLQDDDAEATEESYQLLEEAIATLPPQQQQLIELKYVKGHSIHEMAEITGLSETNVTTLMSRAYLTLRKKMENGIQ